MARARKPFCHDCGKADCHVTGDEKTGLVWLCGSCELIRSDPLADRSKVPPGLPGNWRKTGKTKQKETLFGD